jgi:hypothetical protein
MDRPLFIQKWREINESLSQQPELKKKLQQPFLTEFSQLKLLPESSDLVQIFANPLYPPSPLSPLIWQKESTVKDLRESILFYLLSSYEPITVAHLAGSSKEKPPSILLHTKRFNQVTHFFIEELLFCEDCSASKGIVKTLCFVQKELLDSFAFEAAFAVYAIFQQASIKRLSLAFEQVSGFYELFRHPDALFEQKMNAKELRRLQFEHQTSFEVFSLTLQDLTHIRDNPCVLTKNGTINLDRLRQCGALFNGFSMRKNHALFHWASKEKLVPSLPFIQAFKAQSGIEDEALEQKWYDRSRIVHPFKSKRFWGEKIMRNV